MKHTPRHPRAVTAVLVSSILSLAFTTSAVASSSSEPDDQTGPRPPVAEQPEDLAADPAAGAVGHRDGHDGAGDHSRADDDPGAHDHGCPDDDRRPDHHGPRGTTPVDGSARHGPGGLHPAAGADRQDRQRCQLASADRSQPGGHRVRGDRRGSDPFRRRVQLRGLRPGRQHPLRTHPGRAAVRQLQRPDLRLQRW